ncbi:hypothetical protein J6590_003161 [Homalodisca vitripennis]|nr:hypothetical protein J6590_003161 [Homalodisca vitripennis]
MLLGYSGLASGGDIYWLLSDWWPKVARDLGPTDPPTNLYRAGTMIQIYYWFLYVKCAVREMAQSTNGHGFLIRFTILLYDRSAPRLPLSLPLKSPESNLLPAVFNERRGHFWRYDLGLPAHLRAPVTSFRSLVSSGDYRPELKYFGSFNAQISVISIELTSTLFDA